MSLRIHVGAARVMIGDGPLAVRAPSAMAPLVHVVVVPVCLVGGRCFVGVGSGQEKVSERTHFSIRVDSVHQTHVGKRRLSLTPKLICGARKWVHLSLIPDFELKSSNKKHRKNGLDLILLPVSRVRTQVK